MNVTTALDSAVRPQAPRTSGLTPRALVIGGLLSGLWVLYVCLLVYEVPLWSAQSMLLMGFGSAFTLWGLTFLNGWFSERTRLTVRELTIVYVMVGTAIPAGILARGAIESPVLIAVTYTTPDDLTPGWLTSAGYLPPSVSAMRRLREGQVALNEIPWGLWWRPIAFLTGTLLAMEVFALSLVILLKRIFIDEERLPFPMAELQAEIITHTPTHERRDTKLAVVLRVAFVLGLLICVPNLLGVPDSHIFPAADAGATAVPIASGISVNLSLDPFVLCFLVFFPLDVLLTASLGYLTLQVLVPAFCIWMGLGTVAIDVSNICGAGGLLGLAVWPLVFNRRLIARKFRDFLSGNLSRAWWWLVGAMIASLLVFCFLFVLGLGSISRGGQLDHNLIAAFVTLALIVILTLALLRQQGEQGWRANSPWGGVSFIRSIHATFFQTPTPLQDTQGSFLNMWQFTQYGSVANTFSPQAHAIESFRVAELTGTRPRDLVKMLFVVMVIVILVTPPLWLGIAYHYGYTNAWGSDEYKPYTQSQPAHAFGFRSAAFGFLAWSYVNIAIGFLLMGGIIYMRREYVGFPFSPVGFVMIAAGSYYQGGAGAASLMWFPMLVIYAVKSMTFRWFGVTWFLKVGRPAVVYLMMGLMLGIVVFTLIHTLLGRGFIHFH